MTAFAVIFVDVGLKFFYNEYINISGEANMSYAEQVSKTIIQQFGGNRAFQMIGLNSASYGTSKGDDSILPSGNEGDVYVDIRFKAKAAKVKGKSPNGFRIIYNQNLDVYTVVFYRIHGLNVTCLKVLENVYCDMIQDIFENTTKLYLSL